MGKQATEVGHQEGALVTRIAGLPDASRVFAGLSDGRVWSLDLGGTKIDHLKAEKGEPISALAVAPDGRRVAWGDEAGEAGVAELP